MKKHWNSSLYIILIRPPVFKSVQVTYTFFMCLFLTPGNYKVYKEEALTPFNSGKCLWVTCTHK